MTSVTTTGLPATSSSISSAGTHVPERGRRHVRGRRPGDQPAVRRRSRPGGPAGHRPRGRRGARRRSPAGPWPRLAARRRAKILNRIADGIEARGEQIAALETFDTGLPVTQAQRPGGARGGELPVLRRRDRRRSTRTRSARPGSARLRAPQARRGRRADHAVEHAVHAGVAGSSHPALAVRLHGGAQA